MDARFLNLTIKEYLSEYYTLYDGCNEKPVGVIHKSDIGIIEEFNKQNPESKIYTDCPIPHVGFLVLMSKKEIFMFFKKRNRW